MRHKNPQTSVSQQRCEAIQIPNAYWIVTAARLWKTTVSWSRVYGAPLETAVSRLYEAPAPLSRQSTAVVSLQHYAPLALYSVHQLATTWS